MVAPGNAVTRPSEPAGFAGVRIGGLAAKSRWIGLRLRSGVSGQAHAVVALGLEPLGEALNKDVRA